MGFNPYMIDFSPRELVQELDKYIVGQQKLKRDVALTLWNHFIYLGIKESGQARNVEKSNLFIWGPPGTGKTETCKKAFEIVGVPHLVVDITSYTDAGYIGDKVENIVKNYLNYAGNPELARYGVIQIDEIDKKHRNESAGIDVSGVRVQQQLLKLIEGEVVRYDDKSTFDTRDLLFFVSGAFEGIENQAKFSHKQSSLGFTAKKSYEGGRIAEPTLEDFMKYGMIPEFLRRFGTFTRTEKLGEEELYQILKLETCKPRNKIVENFRASGMEIEFTDAALRKISQKAAEQKLGASGLSIVLNDMFNDFQFELSDRDIAQLVITPDIVENPSQCLDDLLTKLPRKKKNVPKNFALNSDTEGRAEFSFPNSPELYQQELDLIGTNELLSKYTATYFWEKGFSIEKALDTYRLWNARIDNIERDFLDNYDKELNITPSARAVAIRNIIENEAMNLEIYFAMRFKFWMHAQEFKESPAGKFDLNIKDCLEPERFYKKINNGKKNN